MRRYKRNRVTSLEAVTFLLATGSKLHMFYCLTATTSPPNQVHYSTHTHNAAPLPTPNTQRTKLMAEITTQQEIQNKINEFVGRAKEVSRKAYLVGVGAYTRAEETAQTLYNDYAAAGAEAFGEQAESKAKAVLASRGLLAALQGLQATLPAKRQEIYERCVEAGRKEKAEAAESTNEFVLAAVGASVLAKEEGEKFIDELLAAGEKRSA